MKIKTGIDIIEVKRIKDAIESSNGVFTNKIEHILLDALEDSEFKSKLQNSFYINHVDFQYL